MIHFGIINTTIIDGKIRSQHENCVNWMRPDEKAVRRFQSFKNGGINKLANASSDVTIQWGKTRFGLRFQFYKNISPKFPFIKLVYPYVINFTIFNKFLIILIFTVTFLYHIFLIYYC